MLNSILPADWVNLYSLSPRRVLLMASAAAVAILLCVYVLWRLPILAWFRKPIELSGQCPHCGSRDVRPSHVVSVVDRFRKKLGLLPFRCRGCTRRFISRSSGEPSSEWQHPVEVR